MDMFLNSAFIGMAGPVAVMGATITALLVGCGDSNDVIRRKEAAAARRNRRKSHGRHSSKSRKSKHGVSSSKKGVKHSHHGHNLSKSGKSRSRSSKKTGANVSGVSGRSASKRKSTGSSKKPASLDLKKNVEKKAVEIKDKAKPGAKEVASKLHKAAGDVSKSSKSSKKSSSKSSGPSKKSSHSKKSSSKKGGPSYNKSRKKVSQMIPHSRYVPVPYSDIPDVCLEPQELRYNIKGGSQKVLLTNKSKERLAIKVKCSDNDLFRVNPVYALIEPGQSANFAIYRNNGGSGKADKLVYLVALVQDDVVDPRAPFGDSNNNYPMMVLPLLNEDHQCVCPCAVKT